MAASIAEPNHLGGAQFVPGSPKPEASVLPFTVLNDMRGAETYLLRKGWYDRPDRHPLAPTSPGSMRSLTSLDDYMVDADFMAHRVPFFQEPQYEDRRRHVQMPHASAPSGDENTFCLFPMD